MSAQEELSALAGPVAERGESRLGFGPGLVGFGVAAPDALFVRRAAAGAARSIMVLSQVVFAAAVLAGVAVVAGVVCPGTVRRVAGGE
jgi:hypothetical protein